MRKGTNFKNNWLLAGIAILIIAIVAGVAATLGLSLEAGGVEVTMGPSAERGFAISFARVG